MVSANSRMWRISGFLKYDALPVQTVAGHEEQQVISVLDHSLLIHVEKIDDVISTDDMSNFRQCWSGNAVRFDAEQPGKNFPRGRIHILRNDPADIRWR